MAPNKGFAYDANSYWTQTATVLKGRLAATNSGGGSTFTLKADPAGSILIIYAALPHFIFYALVLLQYTSCLYACICA
jgi:hypothetical protein